MEGNRAFTRTEEVVSQVKEGLVTATGMSCYKGNVDLYPLHTDTFSLTFLLLASLLNTPNYVDMLIQRSELTYLMASEPNFPYGLQVYLQFNFSWVN